MSQTRRLAAILAADVAGYSRLMGADEEGTLERLKSLRREVVDLKITEHHGRIVETTGDGMLVEFPSVVDAVRCAVAVQQAIAERNIGVGADHRIALRIGINRRRDRRGRRLYGDRVYIAARVEALAAPPDPRPGLKEVFMRVRASSLNYRDLMVLKGGGRGPTKIGVVPLSDDAGEVVAIGEGVTRVKIGDRIAGCFHPRWFGGPINPDYLTDRLGANLDGKLAEYAVFNEEAVVTLPSHLSFEEGATLPCAAVTAWVALTGHRRAIAGDTVLTSGSGGVSVFALQFARVLGARVIATTSTAEKAERLKALGASDVINYTETPDWDAKVRELTDGRGVDCIVEIGGPGTIAMSLKALTVGGHVSLIGASLSPSGAGLDPLLLTGRGITLGSISVGSRADFETMNRAIAMHRLHPVIDRTFPFAEAKAAYRHFEGRGHFGKVVITHG